MIILNLRKELYSLTKLTDALNVYTDYAEICVIEQEEYLQLVFENCRYGEKQTVQEFENYLIGLENN